jgi:putative flippase GtrA
MGYKLLLKFIFFCFVGAGAFLVDWLFFNIFYGLGLGFILSIGIAWLISMTFNFTINRNITFRAGEHALSSQLVKWLGIQSVSFLARAVAGKTTLLIIGESVLNANIAFVAGLAVSIPINFFGSLLWAFRKHHSS